MRKLGSKEAINLRDQLREARFKARKDAEAFEEVVFVVERLGCYLRKEKGDLGKYRPFIVKDVVSAQMWQPLSFIRQTMLVNSFSFLPLNEPTAPKRWKLVSDTAVAVYLGLKSGGAAQRDLFAQPLEDAVRNG